MFGEVRNNEREEWGIVKGGVRNSDKWEIREKYNSPNPNPRIMITPGTNMEWAKIAHSTP